ncbi:MAG TPA: LysR family transcriptional regulator, partial [Bryobacteraceae bacterium]|nr:LysR family transcriptional regulator [Bryobacteraceae bacterium]
LKLFRDIAQTGSMSRGAAMNDVSQSAASQHVQELERALEIELIDRSRRPLQLTQAGDLYAGMCRDVLRRKDEFDQALGQLRSGVVGTVRVASIFSVGLMEMSRLEEQFLSRYPQATLQVEYLRPEKVYEAIRNDSADLGLVSYPLTAKDVAAIPWRQEEMGLAAAASHPIASRSKVQPSDLQGLEFIAFDQDLPIRKEVDRFLKEHGVTVEITMHLDSIPMIKEALALGNGVSILPSRMLRADVAEGRLVCIPLEAPGLIRPLGIVHLKKKRLNRATQTFLALLQEAEQPVNGPR